MMDWDVSVGGSTERVTEALQDLARQIEVSGHVELVVPPNGRGPGLILQFWCEEEEDWMKRAGDDPRLLVEFREKEEDG